MQRRWSSSSSSEIPPESWPAKQIAREGGAVRYRARVEYDGTDFAGFAVQPGRRTVQGELERALTQLSAAGRVARVDGAGRTDAGVHAAGQVIAFTYVGRLAADELERALSALLPADIGLAQLHRVALDYRPRYRARRREYRYSIWNGPRSPLHERYALGVRAELDTAAMQAAGSRLVGRHDFSAFGGRDRQPVRTLLAVEVHRHGSTVTIRVIGDAFLRQMVRRIAAALLRVGRGEATPDEVAAALKQPSRPAFSGASAPAHGLSLHRVTLGRSKRKMEATT